MIGSIDPRVLAQISAQFSMGKPISDRPRKAFDEGESEEKDSDKEDQPGSHRHRPTARKDFTARPANNKEIDRSIYRFESIHNTNRR